MGTASLAQGRTLPLGFPTPPLCRGIQVLFVGGRQELGPSGYAELSSNPSAAACELQVTSGKVSSVRSLASSSVK